MANPTPPSNGELTKAESRKSHSWWWEGHISPKNSRWLRENLEDMDRSIKHMLRLIEEDADSFAKKAEMYYQKRPMMISYIWEFYTTYRSLVERYDHVTGELRRNLPSDLQSHGSDICDLISEPRAAGFDVFLGSGGSNSDTCQKEGYDSSFFTDSEPGSDDSSVYNYSDGDQGLNRKMMELENELREAKEQLHMKEDNAEECSFPFKAATDENSDIQVMRLKSEHQKNVLSELTKDLQAESVSATMADTQKHEDGILVEELRITKEKLENSQKEHSKLKFELENNKAPEKICHLPDELEAARKDTDTWKDKVSADRRAVAELQERISRLKARDLKLAVSNAEHKIFPENVTITAEISQPPKEQALLEDEIRKVKTEKEDLKERLNREIENLISGHNGFQSERDQLHAELITLKENLSSKGKLVQKLERERVELEGKVERQRVVIMEGAEEKREAIRQLCFSIEHYRSGYHMLREVFISQKRDLGFASQGCIGSQTI
ncbi:protein NETWORKED 4A-like isoform X1 [Cucurbita pepo subsp. pepo]|uniref:protein NETWORKED 4A-like isoform X1 n=1 Tax=Cucurbita pepo subsp. pepo TaxID=3664 RepID=UPI000C9D695B|nr:protein NETWORKED 4A-like isoform X1 [Cucurbita pepo subsp. pepo]